MAEMLRINALPKARYPRLEYALLYAIDEPERWSPFTISAAREGQFERDGCPSWTPPQWAAALDGLEALVQNSTPKPPKPPEPRDRKRS